MNFNTSYINRYPLSKTLRFSLIPVGKTEENFEKHLLLQEDEKRAEDYVKVKTYIDRYHKAYIESVLGNLVLSDITEYSDLYYKRNKTEQDDKKMEQLEMSFRKQISKALKADPRYKLIFKKEMIQKLLPEFLCDAKEKDEVAYFANFTTYFNGFNTNRENIYSEEKKSTAVSYRCINDNLPKFLDNAAIYSNVISCLGEEAYNELEADFSGLASCCVKDMFQPDYFSFVLSQHGIDRYNEVIGGYSCSDGTKIKGINEYINLYNQKLGKGNKKLPLFKCLFKQILSDTDSTSFIPEAFTNDEEVLKTINDFFNCVINEVSFKEVLKRISQLFSQFNTFDPTGIFITNGVAVTNISNAVFGSWSIIVDAWNSEYTKNHPLKNQSKAEQYFDRRNNTYKAIKSFSVFELQGLADIRENRENEKYDGSITKYFSENIDIIISNIFENYTKAENLLATPYKNEKALSKNDAAIELIKNFLDSIKTLEKMLKPLLGTGKEDGKDETFYGEFTALYERIAKIDRLYDKVRNYITQKPYSKDKIKLNFENPVFLAGWPLNLEKARSAQIFKDDNKFYLAVMDSRRKKDIPVEYNSPKTDEDLLKKMVYQQMANPSKDIPNLMVINGITVKKNGRKEKDGEKAGENLILEELRNSYLPKEINRIRKSKSFSKNSESFSRQDLIQYIDFYKERVAEYYSSFDFSFKPSKEYASYPEFLSDVDGQAYQIHFQAVSRAQINSLVESGALYLFQIYNKDFSPHSKGKKNLHTMYFEMLFDERNLKDVVYQLNGGAEMFYRKASIKEKDIIKHPAGIPVKNKNPDNNKKESVFEYDLIKDRRFTKRQFSLHLPITLNFKGNGGSTNLNSDVRKSIRADEENYVIGIDRGERNLLYISVINSKGEIVEQMSGNEIISGTYKVDYHKLLDKKEKERLEARQNWTTVENIKDLKEGYLSVIIHTICELAKKYNAIIAMEDLSSGFKNSRVKVEKQVYQKFEKMLTEKLNYLADKNADIEADGGLLRAYQFTNSTKDYKREGPQDGILFYVPAWLTSKIDPVTGFVDLLKFSYTSIEASKETFSLFDNMKYYQDEDIFSFSFDYSKFPKGSTSFRNKWEVFSNGERIYTFRDKNNNSEWTSKTIYLTEEFKKLFSEYGIDYHSDLQKQIINQDKAEFFRKFTHLLSLTMQMRNSISNSDVDYLISPVKDDKGNFFDSRNNIKNLPENADANGAYNIARKALWAIGKIKEADEDEVAKVKLSVSNKEWLAYVQKSK